MKTIRLKVKQLKEVNVGWVSLVDRPANQAPIKITKREEPDMTINLTKAFGDGGSAMKPIVTSIVLKSSQHDEKYIEEIGKHGFSTEDREENEGIIVFKQAEANDDDQILLKVDEHVGIVLSNVQKYFDPYGESDSFGEAVKKQGFFPSLYMATDALMMTIADTIHKAENEMPVKAIKKTLNEFSAFVTDLASGVPASVFKMEKGIAGLEFKDEQSEETSEEDPDETVAKSEETSEETTQAASTEEEQSSDEGEGESAEEEMGDEDSDKIAVLMKDVLAEAIKPLQESLSALDSKVDEKVGELKKATDKTIKDVAGLKKSVVKSSVPMNDSPASEDTEEDKSSYANMVQFRDIRV